MNGTPTSIDDDLRVAQIENAKLDSQIKALDVKLKEFELQHKPGFWKGVLASPAFLAALIAVFATAGTASVTWIAASQQRELDERRNALQVLAEKERHQASVSLERTKYQVSLLSGIVLAAKPGERCPTADQLTAFIGAQIFTDIGLREEVQRMHKFYSEQCKISGR